MVAPGVGDAVFVEQSGDHGGGVESAAEVRDALVPGGGLGVVDAGQDLGQSAVGVGDGGKVSGDALSEFLWKVAEFVEVA